MLDDRAVDRHYKNAERSDADMHADAIRDQLGMKIEADKW